MLAWRTLPMLTGPAPARPRPGLPVIDTHCHLTFPEFASRIPRVLADAAEHAVTGLITISTTVPDAREALALARTHARVWSTAGVHPLYSDRAPHDWEDLARTAADPRCVAWGELGLDYHYDRPARDVQHRVLEEQLAHIASWHAHAARAKPIVLHCREAFDALIPILARSGLDPSRFVFHCFTGTAPQARACLDFGAMISFTGVVTYHNARDVQEAARLVPLDRIMVETDAPFLSPAPHRGRRPCEPWMASITARRLAELRAEPWDTFHHAINANVRRFFGVPADDA